MEDFKRVVNTTFGSYLLRSDGSSSAKVSEFDLALVDIYTLMDPGKSGSFGGYSKDYYLKALANTFFSLDGLHPSNLGYAVIANAFIDAINTKYQLNIEKLVTDSFMDQYSSGG